VPIETRHLQISRIFSNVGIIKRALSVSLFERTVVEHIVEDHWNAQGADLDALRRLVFDVKSQDEFS
jgi:hypothetical protein